MILENNKGIAQEIGKVHNDVNVLRGNVQDIVVRLTKLFDFMTTSFKSNTIKKEEVL